MILVGPSASGKTEVAQVLIEKFNMEKMVTYTTRPMRRGGMNWETGIDICTLLCIKQITNESPLYSPGNCT